MEEQTYNEVDGNISYLIGLEELNTRKNRFEVNSEDG